MKKTIEGFVVSKQALRFLCIGGAITLFDWGSFALLFLCKQDGPLKKLCRQHRL
jgi:putative flippase GtrA